LDLAPEAAREVRCFQALATQVPPASAVENLQELPVTTYEVPFGTIPGTFQDCWFSVKKDSCFVYWAFYNGAMGASQCQRLATLIRNCGKLPGIKTVLLMGGSNAFSNGIDLNAIEASTNPAEESHRSIEAVNGVAKAIFSNHDKLVVSVLRSSAGAGGVMIALVADLVLADRNITLNPHYKLMNLSGSEYWTH